METTVDPASARKLKNNIRAMHRATGADIKKVVRNAGRDFARSAMRFTPMAPFGNAPRTRGFAKAGWVKAMEGLGMVVRASHHLRGGRRGTAMGIFTDGRSGWRPFVDVGNAVPFIMLLDRGGGGNSAAHIQSRASDHVSRRMGRTLDRLAQRQKRKWRG